MHELFKVFGCAVMSCLIIVHCTPPPKIIIQKCPEQPWVKYSSYQPLQIREEIARLEAIVAKGDTARPRPAGTCVGADSTMPKKPSGLEIRRRLFELAIHCANPDLDLDKIIVYAYFLGNNDGADSLRYFNWTRIAREQNGLIRQRDSLQNVVSEIIEQEKKEAKSAENLKKDIKAYVKLRDSLNAVIADQQEKMMKLQKVDVMMEQQRTKSH
jgi:hypothetical protein